MKILIRNLIKAVKSRREYKKERTELQIKRLNKCKNCPINSDNKKSKSFKDNFYILLNKILDFIIRVEANENSICTDCGCNLIHKTSIKEEVCPQKEW